MSADSIMNTKWELLALILLPLVGAVGVLLVRSPRQQAWLACGVSGVTAGLSLICILHPGVDITLSLPIAGVMAVFAPDALGLLLAAIANGIGLLVMVYSLDYMHNTPQTGRYYALVLIFIGAMSGLVLTRSFLLLLIFWEMTALCSYALIAFDSDNPAAVRGGLQALVITQLGSIGLLAAILLVHSHLHTDDFAILFAQADALSPNVLALIAFGGLIAAAAKSAQVPFFMWLPGAMEAPTPISALIHAATMVNAGVYLLARFYPVFVTVPGWTEVVVLVGLISALIGALLALGAVDFKRALAYSTISQLGLMMVAVGAGALFAAQFHLLNHAVFKALLFLGAGSVIHATGTRDLSRLGGLGRQMPFTRFVFGVAILALMGVPFLNGFWSKELIIEAGAAHLPLWATAALLLSVGLTALYAVRLMVCVFYGKARQHVHGDAPLMMRVALGVLCLGTFTTWLLAGPLALALRTTLPAHTAWLTWSGYAHMLAAPLTLLTLGVVLVGGAAWFGRDVRPGLRPMWLRYQKVAAVEFGFTRLVSGVVAAVRSVASAAAVTETGATHWNLALVVIGAVGLLVIAWLSRGAL